MSTGQTSLVAWVPSTTVETCWMCGIRLSADQMVPDGGRACTDIRWYCQDAAACTQRWTARAKDGQPAWRA